MSHPTGSGKPDENTDEVAETPDPEHEPATDVTAPATDVTAPATDVTAPADPGVDETSGEPDERRFTAPSGFDAGSTEIIDRPADPATEVLPATEGGQTEAFTAQQPVPPQTIPPREDAPRPPKKTRSWGWVAAIVLITVALAAIAVLGTILLTRTSTPAVSQDEMVRATIRDFDIAVQSGDLSTLRGITCGVTRDNYVRYNEKAWSDTHARVAAAKQYPVVASIDQVVVNGDHAEANVTTFMAYAPRTRSTRSFDLEFRDDQWKICQAPAS
jgi:hypothetical protein